MFKRIIVRLSILGVGIVLLFSAAVTSFAQPLKPYEVDSHTLFLCHFEGTAAADYSKGSGLPTGGTGEFTEGKFGKGLTGSINYQGEKNIDFSQGTIEFFFKPNWNGTEAETHSFFGVKSREYNYININFGGKLDSERLGGGINSCPENSEEFTYVRFGIDGDEIRKGKWYHLAVTWGKKGLNLYLDGKLVDTREEAIPPLGSPATFYLGCDGVIDEFRISDIPREFGGIAQGNPGKGKTTKEEGLVYLSDLKPIRTATEHLKLGKDCFMRPQGPVPLTMKGIIYAKGLGMHAYAEAVYKIEGKYARFLSLIGVSDYAGNSASVVFEVYGDGKRLYQSNLFTHKRNPEKIEIPVSKVKELKIVLLDGGNGISCDHGLWVDALLLKKNALAPTSSKKGVVEVKKKKKKIESEVRVPNPYLYHFPLPSSKKGYHLARKNYLDAMSQELPLPLVKELVLSTFATPGEYEPLSFVIYAQEEMKDIRIEISDLRKKGREIIPKKNIDIRYGARLAVKQYYFSRRMKPVLKINTQFLRKFNTVSLPEKNFREIYLTIKVPEKTKPGIYKGKVKVSSSNLSASYINLSLEILSFKLKNNPNKKGGMWYSLAPRLMTPEIANLELQDMKAHGVEIVGLNFGIGIGYRKISSDNQTKILYDYSQIERALSLLRENGFKGEVTINTGLSTLAIMMGYKRAKFVSRAAKAAKLLLENKEFLKSAKEAIAGLKKVQRKYPEFELLLSHMDEVFNQGRLPLYIALTKAAQQTPGFRHAIPIHTANKKADKMREEIDPYLDVRIHHGYTFEWWLTRGHTIEEYEEELEKSGDEAWVYHNQRGVWNSPEWFRIINGLYLWISPFKCQIPCTYCYFGHSLSNYPFTGHPMFARYSEEDKSIVSTPVWEAYREGIDDLKYIYTLEELIEQYQVEDRDEEVAEASFYLREVKGMLPKPQGLKPGKPRSAKEAPFINAIAKKLTFEDYQNIRYKIASYIVKLKSGLE